MRKAHINLIFGPVAVGTTRLVPGTIPGFRFILHSGSQVCPGDKPGWMGGGKICDQNVCASFWRRFGKAISAEDFNFQHPAMH